jgi:NNP family nitrate/nitrite transporter-like MFS transporter
MTIRNKATSIRLLDLNSVPMRAFHMAWLAFFLCFFGWFGIAPLLPIIRTELHLTKEQIGNSAIAAVTITILVRVVIGWLCDRIGPRRSYTWLMVLGSLPVMGIGLAHDYKSFLFFRLAIGAIGASFVITQFHTSVMFAPNIVGTANATAAGWGNLGGGVTQFAMPLLFSVFMSFGAGSWWSWRLAMFLAGAALMITGVSYYFLTEDTADGDYNKLRKDGMLAKWSTATNAFWKVCLDSRVWALALLYAASFGVELTVDNFAALYYSDYFHLALAKAGLVASLFGMMNLFARELGGIASDRCNRRWGLRGRVVLLGSTIGAEGLAMTAFSQMHWLPLAIASMMVTGLFVKMSNGANYAIVPFIDRKALGAVAGIVGAGGNAGAVLAGFLFKMPSLTYPQAFLILGLAIAVCSMTAFLVRFSTDEEAEAKREIEARLRASRSAVTAGAIGDYA